MSIRLLVSILVFPIALLGQTLYIASGPGVVTAVQVHPDVVNVVVNMNGDTQTPPPLVVLAGVLLANQSQAVRDQAVQDCLSGKTPPSSVQFGIPNCQTNGTVAVNNDINQRVKSALLTLPPATLQQYGLQVIQ